MVSWLLFQSNETFIFVSVNHETSSLGLSVRSFINFNSTTAKTVSKQTAFELKILELNEIEKHFFATYDWNKVIPTQILKECKKLVFVQK